MDSGLQELERLFREALARFSVPEGSGLRGLDLRRLSTLQPVFQPGYVGSAFLQADKKTLFLAQNPGEGAATEQRQQDVGYGHDLAAFRTGEVDLGTLCEAQERRVASWPVYKGKGIFRDHDDSTLSLLPRDQRLPLREVAILNWFPMKTHRNVAPGPAALVDHLWDRFVLPTIRACNPHAVIILGRSMPGRLVQGIPCTHWQVWHPSDYNVRAWRSKLVASWQQLHGGF